MITDDKKFQKKHRLKLMGLLAGLGAVAVALLIVFFLIIGVSRVDGDSMLPTLIDGQTLVYFRLDRNFERGDIVGVNMPNGDHYVKRVIGIPGDVVDIRDGEVFLNGELLNEPYIQGRTYPTSNIVAYPIRVTEKKVFVLGDNREHSIDSRAIGLVSTVAIPGKILGGK